MKFRFILLVLLSCFFLFYTNCSFADILDDVLYYGETLLEDSNTPSHVQTSARYPVKWSSNLQNYFNNNNIFNRSEVVGLIFYFPGNQAWVDCVVMTSKMDPNFDNVGFYVKGFKFRLDAQSGNFIDGGSTTGNGVRVPYNDGYGILGLNYSPADWNNAYLQNQYVPPYTGPEFTPVNNGTIIVFNELGISETFFRLPFFPNGQNDWTLGYISNYDEVYAINGYFGPYTQSDSNGNVIDESLNNFNYNYYLGTYNGGLCFDSSTGRVYIKKDRLLNKQGYGLRLNYQASIDSNNADDFYEGNYYSYYGYFSLSSGDLISSDLPNYTDINGFINSFGDFWKSDESDLENYDRDLNEALQPKGLFGSGDLFSGELLGNLGYDDSPLQSDYSLFVVRVYRQFINAMRSEYTNSSISFDIHGHTYTYYASDFAVPDSSLKTFVRNFLIAGIFILIIYQIHFIFITIITFDIFGLARSFDQKHTIFM